MVTIIFESHSTTVDNEARRASGWYDAELSELGIGQSKELGERYKDEELDAVFCSDLQRSYKTAEIAFFGRNIPIIQDKRLRECHYGDFTQKPSEIVDAEKPKRIKISFPNGESYEQCVERMRSFLYDLYKNYNGKTVMIIGHRATQYALEHLLKDIPLEKVIPASWKWQPGWMYKIEEMLTYER